MAGMGPWARRVDDGRLRAVLDGKLVLITGASDGVGEATARRLANCGAILLLVARRGERLEALADDVRLAGGQAVPYPADLGDDDAVQALVERVVADHGRVDVVISNAGLSIRRSLELQRDRFHDFTRSMGVNYFGPVRLILGLLPAMQAAGGGHVVNISTVGVRVPAAPRWGAYQSSKGAFETWLRSVEPELQSRGIRTTTVYFSLVRTRMSAPTPVLRYLPGLEPHEAADVVAGALLRRPVAITPPWLGPFELAGTVGRRPAAKGFALSHRYGRDTPEAGGAARVAPAPSGRRSDVRLARSVVSELRRAGALEVPGPARWPAVARAARLGPTMATSAAMSAARWPDRLAAVDEDGELTYEVLAARVEALAGGLHHELGLTPEDVVAVLCRNHRGYLEATLGVARLGADTVFANTELPADQLVAILERHDVRAAVVDDDLAAKLDDGGWRGERIGSRGGPRSIESLVAGKHRLQGPTARTPRMILLTSGTTGLPKGIPRAPSGAAIAGPLVSVVGGLGLRSGDRVLIAPPLFHGFGLGLLGITVAIGATVVVAPRFEVGAAIDTIERRGVDVAIVVPSMLHRLLQVPGAPERCRSLRAVLSGGAPLPPSLAATFMDAFGEILHDGYGASEVGIATLAGPADLRAAPGTVGRPVWGTTVQVVAEDGRPAPPGATGRILVGGPTAAEGRTGPSDTGDLGHLDGDGRLFIDGRADDMVVSGGENVYPRHVADALNEHPAVADVAVIGVPDEEFGQRLRAFVVPSAPVTAGELVAHVRARRARYEVPREVVLVDDLPRNATGKLLLGELRDR